MLEDRNMEPEKILESFQRAQQEDSSSENEDEKIGPLDLDLLLTPRDPPEGNAAKNKSNGGGWIHSQEACSEAHEPGHSHVPSHKETRADKGNNYPRNLGETRKPTSRQ